MRRLGLLLAALLCLACRVAWADDFTLPGLEADSAAYQQTLTSRFPAGGTPPARKQAEQAAAAAIRKQDWAAAAAAWETRVAQGDAAAAQWLALAEAQLRRTPPEANHALQAAWQNFTAADSGAPEVPALLLMAEALQALNRPAQAIQALEAAAERAPDNKAIVQKLYEARRATGILVRRVATEPEAEPPRVCINFTVAPARRDDFHAEDWVRLDPPVQGAAVTREGDQICVSGLPSGATTRIVLRAGMPGESGLSLVKDTALNIAMGNRRPRIDFDTRMFLLPRGQTPAIGLSTVNLSSVKLSLARLTERNVIGFMRSARLGQPIESWDAERIGEQTGRIVWQGGADIPGWQPNRSAHTALPMPDALAGSGPGLYALSATAGDGTPNAPTGVQMILRTDFAPTIWRGTDGLTVQVRGYSDVHPRPGVTLRLLAENNEILERDHHRRRRRRPLRRTAYARRWPGRPPCDRGAWRRRLHPARPQRRRVRPVRSRGDRAAASGTARRLCLAGSRHLPARRDSTGDGAAARQRRPPRRHTSACDREAAKRPGVPRCDPGAGIGRRGAPARHAVEWRAGRHLDD